MTSDDNEVLLCCLLWARDGAAAGLAAYEDRVLTLISEHGGQVVQRAQSGGLHDHPQEVQLLRFRSQAMVDAYLADPRRVSLAAERDRVIERTELFPVSLA